jgi:hypothetical protein
LNPGHKAGKKLVVKNNVCGYFSSSMDAIIINTNNHQSSIIIASSSKIPVVRHPPASYYP